MTEITCKYSDPLSNAGHSIDIHNPPKIDSEIILTYSEHASTNPGHVVQDLQFLSTVIMSVSNIIFLKELF